MFATARYVCGAVAGLVLIACAERRYAEGPVVIDTLPSGVVVVRNLAGAADRDQGWRLELETTLGAEERTDAGPSTVVFGRVADVVVGPHDEIYVLDGRASEIMVFARKSLTPVRRFGRPGPGPGEFNSPYAMAFDAQGRLWVAQESGSRYTVVDTAGSFIAMHQRPLRFGFTRGELRVSSDGDLHEIATVGRRAARRLAVGDSVFVRDTTPLPPPNRIVFRRTVGTEEFMARVPFAPSEAVALGPAGEVWHSAGDPYRLARLGPRGDTLRIIEMVVEPAPLSSEDRATADADIARFIREGYDVDRTLVPAAHPALSAIVAAHDGHVWVQRMAKAQDDVGPGSSLVYDIFDPDGAFVSTVPTRLVESPAPYITRDLVVGVSLGPDDEQRVDVYRIVRP